MKINIFPKLRKQKKNSSQALGINLEFNNSFISINNLPNQLESIEEHENKDIIFTDLNSDNITPISSIVKHINNSVDLNLHIPKNLEGWLKAIILEEDYSSKKLQEVTPIHYDNGIEEDILTNENITITRKNVSNSSFKELLDIHITSLQTRIFYCELGDITKEVPIEIVGADILFVSIPGYLSVENCNVTIELLLESLRKNNVNSAIFATETGLLLTLPQTVPIFKEEQKGYPYKLDIGPVKCSVYYNKYKNKAKDFIPITIEDDNKQNRMLLGMYDSMYQYYGTLSEEYDFSSIILANSSYKEVVLSHGLSNLKQNINMFCGETMHKAILYFKDYAEKYRGDTVDLFNFYISPLKEIKKHVIADFEVVMIPYSNDHSFSVTRIKDVSSNEFLVFTETINNLEFLDKVLKGVDNLIIMVKNNELTLLDDKVDELKELQNKHNIERMVIGSSNGIEIFCPDDDIEE